MSFVSLTSCEEFVRKLWWVILFILACYMCYERGLKRRNQDFAKLSKQHSELQNEKLKAEAIQENLILQINSQSDPAWVELTLMKELGLVPEEETKIIFTIPQRSQ